jgi:hypothetical protein
MQTRLWWRLWRLRLARVWSQAVDIVLVFLAEIWPSRREDFFVFNLLYKEFYKFLTFNAICEDDRAVN